MCNETKALVCHTEMQRSNEELPTSCRLSSSRADHRGLDYSLPHIELSLYKNSFVNRCLFNMIQFHLICTLCVSHYNRSYLVTSLTFSCTFYYHCSRNFFILVFSFMFLFMFGLVCVCHTIIKGYLLTYFSLLYGLATIDAATSRLKQTALFGWSLKTCIGLR